MTSEEYPLKRLQAFNDEIAIEIRKRIEGGTITFDEKAPSKPAVRVVFRDSDMTDAGLDHLNRDLSTAGQARDRL